MVGVNKLGLSLFNTDLLTVGGCQKNRPPMEAERISGMHQTDKKLFCLQLNRYIIPKVQYFKKGIQRLGIVNSDMKSVFISLLVLLVFCVLSSKAQDDCPVRDKAAAVAEDSTRTCRKACTDEADCTNINENCLCDDLCGLSCYNPDAECPDLTDTLTDGTVTMRNGRQYGEAARHACDRSYYLDGVLKRICRSTGSWSHTAPSCKMGCPRPEASSTSYADIDLVSMGFKVGTSITHRCRTGYQTTESNMDMTTECLSTFLWSATQFVCVRQVCGHPGTITNGQLEGDSFEFGDSVTYVCDPGYLMDGIATRRCNAGPGWIPDGNLPVCDPLSCPTPAVLENGKVDDKFALNRELKDEITYSCNPGYKLVGSETGKCNEEGNWGPVPICALDIGCDFEIFANQICAYTIESGSFERKQVTQSNGFPGFSLVGDGVLKSQAFPLVGEDTTCISFEFKTQSPDDLAAFAINSAGNSKMLYSAPASAEWKSGQFSLSKVNSADKDVFLEFRTTSPVTIDNILQIVDSECSTETTRPTALPTAPGPGVITLAPMSPGLQTWAIALIVIGVLAIIGVAGGSVYYFTKRGNAKPYQPPVSANITNSSNKNVEYKI